MLATTEAYGLTFEFPAHDEAVGAMLRDHGEFARPELDFLLDHAGTQTGALLDIGANIGAIGLPFAAQRPAWQIVAVEAFGGLAEILKTNVRRNELENVVALHAAAGDRRQMVDFPHVELTARGNYGNLGFSYPATDSRAVQMVTLDEIAPPNTRLVKVDVQGAEPSVLRGAARLRHAVRPVWLVEATKEWWNSALEVIEILRSDSYDLYWFFSPHATPSSPRSRPTNPFRGDTGVVALPAGTPNRWNLTAVTDTGARPPVDIGAYPYLARYAANRSG